MKSFIFIIGFMFLAISAYAQQTIVATVSGGLATLSVSELTLIDAWEDELNDGTTIDSVTVDYYSPNSAYYLYAWGTNGPLGKGCAYELDDDGNGNLTLSLSETMYLCTTNDCYLGGIMNCGQPQLCDCQGHGGNCIQESNKPTNGHGYLGSFY